MSRGRQLLVVLTAVVVLTSALNHALIRWLDIRTDVIDRGKINPETAGPPILVTGSSLTFFGVSWGRISANLQRPIITRSVGGASPCELEPLLREVPEAGRLMIGVSIFDLNENNLSDSRASLVPFSQTWSDLRATQTDWTASKRVLWMYPLPWLQHVFPLAGRSSAVMVNAREKVRALRPRSPAAEPESRLAFKSDEDSGHPEKLSDWDRGRVARNLSQLAASAFAQGRFSGPKSQALARILARAPRSEPTLLLVLPVSPPYREAFASEAAQADFERAIGQAQAADSKLQVLRLDQHPALQSAEVFWDLVHLNDDGRRIATGLVIDHLSVPPAR